MEGGGEGSDGCGIGAHGDVAGRLERGSWRLDEWWAGRRARSDEWPTGMVKTGEGRVVCVGTKGGTCSGHTAPDGVLWVLIKRE